MRFGIVGGFLPDRMEDLTQEMCQRARHLGFSGIFGRFKENDPYLVSKKQAHLLRDMLLGEGFRLFEVTG